MSMHVFPPRCSWPNHIQIEITCKCVLICIHINNSLRSNIVIDFPYTCNAMSLSNWCIFFEFSVTIIEQTRAMHEQASPHGHPKSGHEEGKKKADWGSSPRGTSSVKPKTQQYLYVPNLYVLKQSIKDIYYYNRIKRDHKNSRIKQLCVISLIYVKPCTSVNSSPGKRTT